MGSLYSTIKRKKMALSCYWSAKQLVEQIDHQTLVEKVQQLKESL